MTYINQNGQQDHPWFILHVSLSPEEKEKDKPKKESKSRSYLDLSRYVEPVVLWLIELLEKGAYAFFDKVFMPRLERLRIMYERWRNRNK